MCANCEYEDFVFGCESLIESCEMLQDENPRAWGYAESVMDKAKNMKEWAKDNAHVTDKMKTALTNMEEGVEKWNH